MANEYCWLWLSFSYGKHAINNAKYGDNGGSSYILAASAQWKKAKYYEIKKAGSNGKCGVSSWHLKALLQPNAMKPEESGWPANLSTGSWLCNGANNGENYVAEYKAIINGISAKLMASGVMANSAKSIMKSVSWRSNQLKLCGCEKYNAISAAEITEKLIKASGSYNAAIGISGS